MEKMKPFTIHYTEGGASETARFRGVDAEHAEHAEERFYDSLHEHGGCEGVTVTRVTPAPSKTRKNQRPHSH